MDCIQKVLSKEPNCKENGKLAINYLFEYSQLQVFKIKINILINLKKVFYWLKEIFGGIKESNWQKWPKNCSKLICENMRREGMNEEIIRNCSLPRIFN